MIWFSRLFDFYINSSIHVSLAVLSLVLLSCEKFELSPTPQFLGFVFFGSISGYNFVKYAGVAQLHHQSLTQSLRVIQVFSLISFGFLVYCIFQLPLDFFWRCLPLGLLTLLYAVPFLPRQRNLRSVPFIKVFIIAAVWAGVSVYLPLAFADKSWSISGLLQLVVHFMLTLVLIVPFELRDLRYDPAHLKTLPQVLGVKKTKTFGYGMVVGFLLFNALAPGNIALGITYALMAFLSGLAISGAATDQSAYYSSFWVEGIPVAGLLAYLVLS
ncbi:MAG: hypothetical protein WBG71_11715 [Leeuwenhoekiella sp.]